jgi:ferrochelatase
MSDSPVDALLLLSYGGPEKREDILPFLQRVTTGKNIPPARLEQVAEKYELFDGRSPLNAENRALLTALIDRLRERNIDLPVYWGNLYWHPLLEETVEAMAAEGIRNALAFATSPYASGPGCGRYHRAMEEARHHVGAEAPRLNKIRHFFNHPGWIHPQAERLREVLSDLDDRDAETIQVFFSAHSIPWEQQEPPLYTQQLLESCRLVAESAGVHSWELVYQSRSGRPSDRWLEPDIHDRIDRLAEENPEKKTIVVVPIGFPSDNMEIVYDLDVAAARQCETLGLEMYRADTVGAHPEYVEMIVDLFQERLDSDHPRKALGSMEPPADQCGPFCLDR